MDSLVIVADDLTGAADCAARCRGAGLPVTLYVSPPRLPLPRGGVTVTSDSRHLSAADAAQHVRTVLDGLIGVPPTRWYKKIDSTLRGHIGSELDAMLDMLGHPQAIICPAFPAQERSLHDGYLVGAAVPIAGLHAPTVIAGQSRRRVHAVPLAAVRAGSAALGDHLVTACARGAHLLVVDATTDADLGVIVEAAGTALPAALLCGSAGLLGALALTTLAVQPMVNARIDEIDEIDGVNEVDGAERAARRAACDGPVVIVVGSGSRRAHAQIAAARAGGVRTIEIGEEPLPDAADTLVLHLPLPDDRALDGPHARQAATVLVEAALSAINRLRPGLLLLVGGDTAITVLTGLGVSHLAVLRELLPGMPLTYGIDAQGIARYVIVKAGNHGDAAVLETLLRITRAGP